MSLKITGKIYRCTIDGTCYQSKETIMAHMKMQHNLANPNSSYMREMTIGDSD
ncbi:MAG TPA: hypothetical protein VEB87_05200 [Nitrososphaerales archaeon]|nr:hypothetical protein [Nitrososphaerales archaeon]